MIPSMELNATTFPEFQERISAHQPTSSSPRSYPGYPQIALARSRKRFFPGLDRALLTRRCHASLSEVMIPQKRLGRLLQFAHSVNHDHGKGTVPSAGGLQALELYLVSWAEGWLAPGGYHYDRQEHRLAQIYASTARPEWEAVVPSMLQVSGGCALWVLIGDGSRACARYGERGLGFLQLEAGHLMQNLCLLSTGVRCCTVPMGGFFENEIAERFSLPTGDVVLYVGLCGAIPSKKGKES